jgi:hypothetical protein
VPILVEDGEGKPVFVPGYGAINGAQRTKLIKEAPPGLWLGGGATMIRVPQGIVTSPDRRHGGNAGPAAQGWAKYEEGPDLSKAATREFIEEMSLYTLGGEDDNLYQPCTEIVPFGVPPKGYVRSLNQALAEVEVFGQLDFFCWCKNEKDRAWIYVSMWDLRELPRAHRLRIIWDDDFPKDLHPGSNPRVLSVETGREVGRFEGAQGYLPNDMAFHPVLRDGFAALAASK